MNDMSDSNTVVVEDAALRAGFTMVPNRILRAPGLSAGAKLTYALLLSYAWQDGSCFPGQERLAVDIGLSVRTVQTYIAELKAGGFIRVELRGMGQTAVYTLTAESPKADTKPASPQTRSRDRIRPEAGFASGTRQASYIQRPTLQRPSNEDGPSLRRAVRGRPIADDDPAKFKRGRYAVCSSCGARPCLC